MINIHGKSYKKCWDKGKIKMLGFNFADLPKHILTLISVLQKDKEMEYALRNDEYLRRVECVRAIQKAISETKKYQEFCAQNPDREFEFQLSEIWSEACEKCLNAKLAIGLTVNGKVEFWRDRDKLPSDFIKDKGLSLEHMEEMLNVLLLDIEKRMSQLNSNER
ncbi:hypothetical protein [Pseudoalteromonas rubra]|nr:hypothetical protein [Pseudoalteromonas rubra]